MSKAASKAAAASTNGGAQDAIKRSAKLIDNTVFDAFKTLTSEQETERFDGSLSLLHHLERSQDAEKHAKERDYTLTRLVRGLGASTLASRAGYFTTLVGFLRSPANADITHDQIIAVLEKQLHVGKAVADKEDSDALVGHVLLVGALMRSDRLRQQTATNAQITQSAEILVRAAGCKVFHASMAYKFLVDLLQTLSADQFAAALWPAVRKELSRPWERHTCNTLHFLMVAHEKYPEVVDAAFLQKTIKTPEILTPVAHKHLGRIFWGNTSLAAITHPAYEALSTFLLSVKRKSLLAFWTGEIAESLAAPNKIKEVVTIKLLTDFLTETAHPLDTKTVLKLLNPRVIRMIVGSLKTLKVQRHDVLVSFYEEFFEALQTYCGSPAVATDDAGRVAIIERFILHPGTLLIEKYLPHKTIHQLVTKLGSAGVQQLFAVYKQIFLNQLAKEPGTPATQWQSVERVQAAQMLQYLLAQKSVHSELAWRSEQLQFLLTVGLFHVNQDASEVVRRDQVAAQPTVTKELALLARNLFFASLQLRLPQLADELLVLQPVFEYANALMQRKSAGKLLRTGGAEWTAETAAAWQRAHEALAEGKETKKTLRLVFQLLFAHMALQLLREPEMARVAIADLAECEAKTRQAKKAAKKAKKGGAVVDDQEPEWIEVVVDLFLHLLSQNTSFMRNLVNNVFPQLCGEVTLTAVHQILAMLDLKDGKNPLSAAGKDGEEEEEDDGDDAAEEADSGDEEDDEDVDMKSDDDEEDDDEEEEEDDDDDDEEDEEGTVTDQLRNAVSGALGSLLPSATNADDDNDSVDLNDMDEEEAARLDSALSAAFQSIRKSTAGSSTSKSKKKTKAERTTNTTVMHFRIRVLDLIEIYLKTAPALAVSVEILLSLFNMIEYCTAADQKPLADKVDKVLKRLLALRQFSSVDDVSAANLRDLMQSLVAKKVNPVTLSAHNQLLSKTFVFLIAAAQLLADNGDSAILALISEYAAEFIQSRNPRVPYSLLQDVFQVRWTGVWLVAAAVAEQALGTGSAAVRTFRRTQALELLASVYRQHGFIAGEVTAFNGQTAKVEATLAEYVRRFAAAAGDREARVSAKEFEALCALLTEVQRAQKVAGVKAVLQWPAIGGQVQKVRAKVVLVTVKLYKRFCQLSGLEVLKNAVGVQAPDAKKLANGGAAEAESDEEQEEEEATTAEVAGGEEKKKAKKRKAGDAVADSKREKKLKKAERLRLASEGLNDLTFRATKVADEEEESD